jgi:hypothetical protein
LFGGFDGRVIVCAAEVNRSDEMAIETNDVNAIVLHRPTSHQAGVQDSQSPMAAEIRAVIVRDYFTAHLLSVRSPTYPIIKGVLISCL